MWSRRGSVFLSVICLAWAAPSVHAARMFCCSDDAGKRICGDVLPAACSKRAYSEINERGLRGPDHAAPLTEAQQAAKDAADQSKRETAKAELDQKRRDQALLATYANESELDNARDRAVKEVMRSIQQSQDKITSAQKEQKKLDGQMAAAKDSDEQVEIREQLSRVKATIRGQEDAIAGKNRDIEKIKAKYEADRVRLRELRSNKLGDTAKP